MTSEPVHYLSLIDVSARLRSGDLKPTTLTEMILARIAQYDGALKSYTTLLADRAMAPKRGRPRDPHLRIFSIRPRGGQSLFRPF
jgi:Asp-tRNA(Asn)/Glu-tRNA(Gln) amidotransferase A subunit family amidase